ncbi:MAG: PQQ-like beta-propeller repeat protein [Pirellulales bacterium]|nr:PQQ-like beta-propeller repeat protein [Pirellulales bacterium]
MRTFITLLIPCFCLLHWKESVALEQELTAVQESQAQDPPRGDLRTRKKGEDWKTFLGPTQDSKSVETGVISPWPQDGLNVRWTVDSGEGYGAPATSLGRLYHFDRIRNSARLRCLRAETGELLWEFTYACDYADRFGYSGGPRCSPLIDEDRVYLFGPAGMLHCLNAINGELIWKRDTSGDFHVIQNFFGVGSTPVVEDDLLLCVVGGSPAEQQDMPPQLFNEIAGAGSGIVAFDKLTGETRYQSSDELACYASPVVREMGSRRVGLAFLRGGLLGFEPKSGKSIFHFPWRAKVWECVNASNPVIVDDQIFISESYGPGSALLKLNVAGNENSLEVVWSDENKGRNKSLQTHWNTPIHLDGYLYACSGRDANPAELRCVEMTTGQVIWKHDPEIGRSSLLYADGHFVCLGEYGDLLLVKAQPDECEIISQWQPQAADGSPLLRNPAWAAPIPSHGLLYLRGANKLICVELIPE